MAAFSVVIDEEANEYLGKLKDKSQRIVKDSLRSLEEDPFPGKGGDKELLGKGIYRIHIARSYTAFYKIFQEDKTVMILWLGTIEQAHKLYGRLMK